ncbi:MAG: alpha-(1-_3)-arabinofuranosyltransferase domain-containing protein, partial [Actinomycetes bacterium]
MFRPIRRVSAPSLVRRAMPAGWSAIHPLTAVVLTVAVFLQDPGRTSFDTKLDLSVDPGGFLSRALHMWNPDGGFGELQNQAFGYLFPIGPFFALGDAVGLPTWVVARTWQALLLVGAYAGVVLLAGRLRLGGTRARWLGGLAYACCPRMLTTIGPLSAEALAVTLLPWILLPLVAPERYGSPRRAAATSALSVLLLGGANGAVTLAVLPLPLLWLLTRESGPVRRRLLAWWTASVAAACLWWFVPLLLLGRYSPRFLDYIETAGNTTAGINPFQVLRGTTHWVAYFNRSGEPWWPAGWELATSPFLVAVTVVVAATGLAGLAHRGMPERRVWLLSVAVGFFTLAAGSAAAGGEPLQALWRHLLDGPLVAFRNVHKFDPLVRLPLALGLVHVVAVLRMSYVQGLARRGRVAVRVAATGVALAVGLSALPLGGSDLNPGPTWSEIPRYWTKAAAYLAERDPAARTLLVPSSGFAEYRWGRTIDEPLQPLARAPWAVRNQVPIGAEGSTRAMDAVEQAVAAGRPAEGLAALLRRSG